MTDKTVLADKAFKYKVRCLNIHRKLFRDLQDHELSPEIKSDCNVMEKAVREENYPLALEYSRKTCYLIKVANQLSLIPDDVFESLDADGKELTEIIEEYTKEEV